MSGKVRERCKKLVSICKKLSGNVIFWVILIIFILVSPVLNVVMLILVIILFIWVVVLNKKKSSKYLIITNIFLCIIIITLFVYKFSPNKNIIYPYIAFIYSIFNSIIILSHPIKYKYTIILLIYAIFISSVVEDYPKEFKNLLKSGDLESLKNLLKSLKNLLKSLKNLLESGDLESLKNLLKSGDLESLNPIQIFSQNYLMTLVVIISIPIALTIWDLSKPLTNLVSNYGSSNFMTLAGVLGAIVSIIMSVSWVVIQTSTSNSNKILMWMWVRDPKFTSFVIVSFSTIFLLIILSLTRIPLYILDFGTIYYIILVNFIMYVLYIMAFSTVINPKHTVDLILRFGKDKNEEGVDNNSDLTDAESRFLAVYDIIRKGIENKDVYLVVKCLNMINKNWNEYWVFKDKENIKKFKEMMYNLCNEYKDKCKEEHFFDKGEKVFKKLCLLLSFLYENVELDIRKYVSTLNKDTILDILKNINTKLDDKEYWKSEYGQDTLRRLNENLSKFKELLKDETNNNETISMNEWDRNKIIEGITSLINKCKELIAK